MIPVLAVPVLRPDLVQRMLASVDVEVGTTLIIDNGGGLGDVPGAWVIRLPTNLGVAASWNLAMKVTPLAPWWAIVNDDLAFAPGDLARLEAAMNVPHPLIATMDGFSAFGINAGALATVGWFDENYHPAYVEDCDMERRAQLARVEITKIEAGLDHARSSTIAVPHFSRSNRRTYPENIAYHARKWGGAPRGGETFETPFNDGRAVTSWTLEPGRLRDLAWEKQP